MQNAQRCELTAAEMQGLCRSFDRVAGVKKSQKNVSKKSLHSDYTKCGVEKAGYVWMNLDIICSNEDLLFVYGFNDTYIMY